MNFGQRYLELGVTYTLMKSTGEVTLHVSQMPPNSNIFQPGPAMIFLVVDGIPSTGQVSDHSASFLHIVSVCPNLLSPPAVTPTDSDMETRTWLTSSDDHDRFRDYWHSAPPPVYCPTSLASPRGAECLERNHRHLRIGSSGCYFEEIVSAGAATHFGHCCHSDLGTGRCLGHDMMSNVRMLSFTRIQDGQNHTEALRIG